LSTSFQHRFNVVSTSLISSNIVSTPSITLNIAMIKMPGPSEISQHRANIAYWDFNVAAQPAVFANIAINVVCVPTQ
jgi:prepilin-type processing-associated H-X9-DG protein